MEGLKKQLQFYREKCDALLALTLEQSREHLAAFARETEAAIDAEMRVRAIQMQQQPAAVAFDDNVYDDEDDGSISYAAAPSSSSSSSAASSSSPSEEEDDPPLEEEEEVVPTPKKKAKDKKKVAKRFAADDDDDDGDVVIVELPKRPRKAPRRYDPSHRPGIDPDDRDQGEDVMSDGEDAKKDASAELRLRLSGLRFWRGQVKRKPVTCWDDIMGGRGSWFVRQYAEKLELVRRNLGGENVNLPEIQKRWDWALTETLAGRKHSFEPVKGAITQSCRLCGGAKLCEYAINGWPMAIFCAKLMEAWISWCQVLADIIAMDAADLGIDELRALDDALARVLAAHARKAEGIKKKK